MIICISHDFCICSFRAAQLGHEGAKTALDEIQCMDAENTPPADLVGQRVDVMGHGVGQVVDFQKVRVLLSSLISFGLVLSRQLRSTRL